MSLWISLGWLLSLSFPRVSGDEPVGLAVVIDDPLFSPRERG